MRSSYLSPNKGTHDRKHNTPGTWTEVLHLLGGVQIFYCCKCPGTRGVGMMDYVKAPRVSRSAIGAPFHSFIVQESKDVWSLVGYHPKNLRSLSEF